MTNRVIESWVSTLLSSRNKVVGGLCKGAVASWNGLSIGTGNNGGRGSKCVSVRMRGGGLLSLCDTSSSS